MKKTSNTYCPFCDFKSQKYNVISHLKKTKKCNTNKTDEQYQEAIDYLKKTRIYNEELDKSKQFCCQYCNKTFSAQGFLNNHQKSRCLVLNKIKEKEALEKLKEEITIVKKENTTLINLLDNLDKTLHSTENHTQSHNQIHTNNNNLNDNNGIINNGVIINNYHNTKDLDHISDKVILRLMGEFRYKFLEELLRLEHFDPEKPQYQNIRLSATDFKNGFIQIYENEKWKKIRIETIIPEKTDYLVLRSINAIDAFKDPDYNLEPEFKPIEKSIERVETFLNTVDINNDNFDKKEYENLVTDMELTVLNNTT